jgi:hypothetical protein
MQIDDAAGTTAFYLTVPLLPRSGPNFPTEYERSCVVTRVRFSLLNPVRNAPTERSVAKLADSREIVTILPCFVPC